MGEEDWDTNWDTNGSLTLNELTDQTHVLVQLYTLIAVLVTTPVFMIVTFLGNLFVLLSFGFKKSLRSSEYAPHLSIVVNNIVSSVTWLPIHCVMLYTSWSGFTNPLSLCYFGQALLFFYIALTNLLIMFLGEIHLKRLGVDPSYNYGPLSRRWVTICVILAIGLGVSVSVEYGYNLSFAVFRHSRVAPPTPGSRYFSIVEVIVCVLYIICTLVMILKNLLAVHEFRKKLKEFYALEKKKQSLEEDAKCQNMNSVHKDELNEPSRFKDEPSKHSTSVTFKNEDEVIPNSDDDYRSKASKTKPHKKKKRNFPFKKKCDDFDVKMQQKVRKSSQSRRHTVANIGSDVKDLSQRKGSLGAPSGGQSGKKEYDYMRKWSVDIEALQAQLANPRLFANTTPVKSLGVLHEAEQNGAKEEEEESGNQVLTKSESVEPMSKPEKSSMKSSSSSHPHGSSSSSTERNTHRPRGSSDTEPSTSKEAHSSLEIPSVFIEPSGDEDKPNAETPLAPEMTHENAIGALAQVAEEAIDKARIKRYKAGLLKTKCIIMLYVVNLICVCPYLITQLIQSWISPKLAFNLLMILVLCHFLSAAIHPLLLILSSGRLRRGCVQFWQLLQNLRCECECHWPGQSPTVIILPGSSDGEEYSDRDNRGGDEQVGGQSDGGDERDTHRSAPSKDKHAAATAEDNPGSEEQEITHTVKPAAD